MAKSDLIHKPEVHNLSQRHQRRTEPLHTKFCEDQFSSSRDMFTDRQTQTDRQTRTDHNIPLPYRSTLMTTKRQLCDICRTSYDADSWRSPSSCPSAVWFGRDDDCDSPKPGGSTRLDIICDGIHDDPGCSGLLGVSPNVLPPPPVPLSSVKWCNDAIQCGGASSFKPITSAHRRQPYLTSKLSTEPTEWRIVTNAPANTAMQQSAVSEGPNMVP